MKKGFRKSMILVAGLTASLTFATVVSADSITVQSGDTLWGLSNKYNVSVDQIKSANGLTSNTIYVGQAINIPTATNNTRTHTVSSGDSLWGIASQYNTTIQSIKSLNNLTSDVIYPGQTLVVSGQASSTGSSYTVQSGDSLWGISQKFNVSVNDIKAWNNLSSNVIYPGQTLNINGGQSSTPAPTKASLAQDIINEAKKYFGTPYVWGGSTPQGFDCSGFLNYVFAQEGVSIPRTVETIYNSETAVSAPAVGDLVFFETYEPGASHAGIYLGNGQFIHASSSKGVTISSMDNVYWQPRYIGAKSYY